MPDSAVIPRQSVLFDLVRSGSYVDCVTRPLPEGHDGNALALYLAVMRPAPRWLNVLLVLRDRMVRPLGLKLVGGFGGNTPAAPAQAGDRLDIFTVKHASDRELTVFIEDTHLDVFISVARLEKGMDRGDGDAVCMATVVNTHNRLGRAYMLVVGPLHRVLVRYVLARAGRRGFMPLR